MAGTGKLNIAMLSAHSCPVGQLGTKDTGGMSVYIRELARELGKQGHRVDVFTRVHDPRDPQFVKLGEGARLVHLKTGSDDDLDKLALYPHLPEFAGNLEDFRRANRLNYDLIFSHYWLSGLAGKTLAGWWQVPHMIMFHTLGAVKNALGIGETEPELRLAAEGELARNCQRIIAATEREKLDLVNYYGAEAGNIKVIPCGVNPDRFRPRKAKDRAALGLDDSPLVVYAGRIEPQKGIDRLIKAMACLTNGRRPRLVIIGGDRQSQPEIDRLKRLSGELGLADRLTFMGTIAHERMPDYYNAASVLVVPSHYESFGLVALEALASGVPVVSTDVGDMKYIIRQGDTGYVVDDGSPYSIGRGIDSMLSKPASRAWAHAISATVAHLSWANIARAISRECYRAADEPVPAGIA